MRKFENKLNKQENDLVRNILLISQKKSTRFFSFFSYSLHTLSDCEKLIKEKIKGYKITGYDAIDTEENIQEITQHLFLRNQYLSDKEFCDAMLDGLDYYYLKELKENNVDRLYKVIKLIVNDLQITVDESGRRKFAGSEQDLFEVISLLASMSPAYKKLMSYLWPRLESFEARTKRQDYIAEKYNLSSREELSSTPPFQRNREEQVQVVVAGGSVRYQQLSDVISSLRI